MKTFIIESPNKSKTIKKYADQIFNDNIKIVATVGHFRDLNPHELSLKIEKDKIQPIYALYKDKKQIVKQIEDASKQSNEIFIATDPDREGEAIAFHVEYLLKRKKIPENKIKRYSFNEITKSAMQKSFQNQSGKIDYNLVKAQETRRILDRLVGYLGSPMLHKYLKESKNHSVGRVQTATLHLIYKRHNIINNFKPEPYYLINLKLSKNNIQFIAKKQFKPNDLNTPNVIEQKYKNKKNIKVLSIQKKAITEQPPQPYTTKTAITDISKKFNFSSSDSAKIMAYLQNLFEKGLITYHRTDSARVSDEGIALAKNIAQQIGISHLFKGNQGKGGTQDGHECIRPTGHGNLNELNNIQRQIYDLIKDRFIASQLKEAKAETTKVVFEDDFRASGKIYTYNGYRDFYKGSVDNKDKKNNSELPDLKENEDISIDSIDKQKKYTQPPQYYTFESILNAMEQKGIGRPSTYSQTISILFKREYIKEFSLNNSTNSNNNSNNNNKKKKYIDITPRGTKVINYILNNKEDNIAWIADISYTSKMESFLDQIANKKIDNNKINNFLIEIYKKLKRGEQIMNEERLPTEKQLRLAKVIADKKGEILTEEVQNSMEKCSKYIEENKNYIIFPPTEKQINFAKSIAEKAGINLPDEVLNNAKKCSEFIEKNKSKMVSLPTEKQINFAKNIANKMGIELPEKVMKSVKECSNFIETNKKELFTK